MCVKSSFVVAQKKKNDALELPSSSSFSTVPASLPFHYVIDYLSTIEVQLKTTFYYKTFLLLQSIHSLSLFFHLFFQSEGSGATEAEKLRTFESLDSKINKAINPSAINTPKCKSRYQPSLKCNTKDVPKTLILIEFPAPINTCLSWHGSFRTQPK